MDKPEITGSRERAPGVFLSFKHSRRAPVSQFGVKWKAQSWWTSSTAYVSKSEEGTEDFQTYEVMLSGVRPGEKVTAWVWAMNDSISSAYTDGKEVERTDNIWSAVFENNVSRCNELFEEVKREGRRQWLEQLDEDGTSLAHWATYSGSFDTLNWLLLKGAPVDCKDAKGMLPIHWACALASDKDKEKRLLQCLVLLLESTGFPIDAPTGRGKTPLMLCVISHLNSMADWLIRKGVDLNAIDVTGETALHWAAYAGNQRMIERFFAEGMDIKVQDSEGQTPLHLAAFKGHPLTTSFLVSKGRRALLHTVDNKGHSVLAVSHTGVRDIIRDALREELHSSLTLFFVKYDMSGLTGLPALVDKHAERRDGLNDTLRQNYGADLKSPELYSWEFWKDVQHRVQLFFVLFSGSAATDLNAERLLETYNQAGGGRKGETAVNVLLDAQFRKSLLDVKGWLLENFRDEMTGIPGVHLPADANQVAPAPANTSSLTVPGGRSADEHASDRASIASSSVPQVPPSEVSEESDGARSEAVPGSHKALSLNPFDPSDDEPISNVVSDRASVGSSSLPVTAQLEDGEVSEGTSEAVPGSHKANSINPYDDAEDGDSGLHEQENGQRNEGHQRGSGNPFDQEQVLEEEEEEEEGMERSGTAQE
eukprot:c14278_g1_i1.p1 GENE.c14278_g1_i1~~c14278_g1_i1.p1  ORF type:complete len:672 (-),score=136.30 c14278_g1_i1:187-2139(-)